ncbi:MAG: peptidoglycan-associated lipoprotein Pal [Desulfatiglans sp.]|jgi:peptidoglycan-associated lipoprotein|nr:peptidoglycan-associated lipoprotein Pal [Thermodesulfobacteriota bacterium]MEE4352746.1 peptidoglycan-associated lipoprotein Pal [Desulfatiglans sp.]
MGKKMITGLVGLAFVCSSFLVMTSCAKKQLQTSETAQQTAQETAPEEAPERVTQPTQPPATGEDSSRRARTEEIQRGQSLADSIRLFESTSIYFDFDRSELKPEAKANLKIKADFLRSNSSYSVRVEGHCDERGTNQYNLALGERRAYSAKRFLEALGISGNRISCISYGEERPANPLHNEEAWARNRRDEFRLVE